MVQEIRTSALRPRTYAKHLAGDSLFNGAKGNNNHPTGNLPKPPSHQPSKALYHESGRYYCPATNSFLEDFREQNCFTCTLSGRNRFPDFYTCHFSSSTLASVTFQNSQSAVGYHGFLEHLGSENHPNFQPLKDYLVYLSPILFRYSKPSSLPRFPGKSWTMFHRPTGKLLPRDCTTLANCKAVLRVPLKTPLCSASFFC